MAWRICCSTSCCRWYGIREAAARYAADPAAAIADAHLAGVTSADVDNLIPMVAIDGGECARLHGAIVPTDGGNVDDGCGHRGLTHSGAVDHQVEGVIHDPAAGSGAHPRRLFRARAGDRRGGAGLTDQSGLDQPGIDHVESTLDDLSSWSDPGGWEHVHDPHPGVDHPGFDANP